MDAITKYRIYQGAVLILFAYLLSTEVYGRWCEAYMTYRSIEQESSPMTFEEYAAKKADLTARKRQLLAEAGKRSGRFEQSPTGVFELLTTTAKKANIRLQGLAPEEIKEEGEFKVVGFKIAFSSSYHQAGSYINDLERGSFPIRVDAVKIQAEPAGTTRLNITVSGRAYVLLGK